MGEKVWFWSVTSRVSRYIYLTNSTPWDVRFCRLIRHGFRLPARNRRYLGAFIPLVVVDGHNSHHQWFDLLASVLPCTHFTTLEGWKAELASNARGFDSITSMKKQTRIGRIVQRFTHYATADENIFQIYS